MHSINATLEKKLAAEAGVFVSRDDGTAVSVRLRLLGYDGCEFQSDEGFAIGDLVSLHLDRMGSIRARITASQGSVIEAEFVKECPV
jgi:hypothetical protein